MLRKIIIRSFFLFFPFPRNSVITFDASFDIHYIRE